MRGKDRQGSRFREIMDVLQKHDLLHGIDPKKLRDILEELGPTFIKMGQILSMRPDLVPTEYCDELAHLRSEVTPMPFEEVEQVIRDEYGVKNSRSVFALIDPTPLGSASIAQVHHASLKDGVSVVVKVQRPGIRQVMYRDVQILRRVIPLLKLKPELGDPSDFRLILDELWTAVQQEMDFLIEASHLEEFQNLNKDIVYVGCPKVNKELTTSRILVMEYIEGTPINHTDELLEGGYDLDEIAAKLAENYVKQVLDDGFFHGDPHPGNIFIRDGKIIWLDLGMMGRFTSRDKALITDAVKAIQTGDIYQLKSVVLSMGVLRRKIDHAALYTDIDLMLNKYAATDFASLNLGNVFLDLNNVMVKHRIGMPPGVSVFGRGMVAIEGVLAELCPNISLMDILVTHMVGLKVDWEKEFRDTGFSILHALKKGADVPGHIADILKMVVKGQTKLNLEITGSEEPLKEVDRMVNKLVIAIICAALLIGSSMICTTDMAGKLFGIPALGGIGYLIALILGAWLLYGIIKKK